MSRSQKLHKINISIKSWSFLIDMQVYRKLS